MNKKILTIILSAILVFSLGTGMMAYADELSDKQNELDSVNQQKDKVESSLEQKIAEMEEQQKEVEKVQNELNEKQAQINQTLSDIEDMKAKIEDRREGLNQRLRTMYKKGSVGYIDVLLGSNNISELLSNVEMIQRIYRNDQKVLTELKSQHEALDEKQKQLLKEKEEIDKKKAVADEEQAELKGQKDELKAEFDRMDAEAASLREQIRELNTPPVIPAPAPTDGPFIWPATSRYITDYYGWRMHPIHGYMKFHSGIDIGCGYGTPIYATASGVVTAASEIGGYGLAVEINHGNGYSSFYAHNSSLAVGVGQYVNQGDVIAYCGSTGWSTGPHLHFEILLNGATVDPMQFF